MVGRPDGSLRWLTTAFIAGSMHACGTESNAPKPSPGTDASAASPTMSPPDAATAVTTDAAADAASMAPNLPFDEREVTFPTSMSAWGWLDVTEEGAAINCPDAMPNKSDAASVAQTTLAIQCRLNGLGIGNNPGSLYFPAGTYYIDKTLSLTQAYYAPGQDGGSTLTYWGGGNRSQWTGEAHISGEDPATTKIVWSGSCGTDPNVADPVNVTKYNDILYIDGISPLIIERLTLDGQNCAGDGIDMVSKPGNMSGVSINEMTIENLKEVGIVGDRPNITKDEIREGDNSGMVSEVTITNVSFAHIGYACVMPDAPNAVDFWIRDSTFSDCGIGVTNTHGGNGIFPGMPQAAPLAWGNSGPGGFEIANCIFENSRTADIFGGTSVRNSYSTASHGPFLEVFNAFFAQGNTVIASKGVMPVVSWGGTSGLNVDQMVLLKNKFITADNGPAVLVWTKTWGLTYPTNAYQGSSPSVGNLWNETYSDVASIGNQFTSTMPFSVATGSAASKDDAEATDLAGWGPSSANVLQCGPVGGTASSVDGRTYCSFPGPDLNPVYNLLTFDDELGVSLDPSPPTPPPIRPIVDRHYIIPTLTQANTPEGATANNAALQSSIAALASNQASCDQADYSCPDRWSILFIPSGTFFVSTPIDVPGSVQIQIVGTGQSNLAWLPYGGDDGGAPAPSTPILRLHAPSHVAIRDLALFGEPDIHSPNPLGEGLVAEVTDLPTSRVFSDALRLWGGFNAVGMGNAVFDMRSFGTGAPSSVLGNRGDNAGYFAFFGGNPTSVTVGAGANLMIQDSWYEGNQSNFVACADGDAANVTVETSNVTPGGWHGVFTTAQTTFNIGGCATKTVVIASGLSRDGWSGRAPTASIVLPASATAATELLSLANASINSDFGDSEGNVPEAFSGSIDQGYLSVDPASKAQYADILGTFFQTLTDASGSSDRADLAARATGSVQAAFIRAMLDQANDARQMAPSFVLSPITDMKSTDIRIEHVWTAGAKSNLDIQFVLPGGAAQ
jgi:hypothetical protein